MNNEQQVKTDIKGPLAGLNVIDFGHYYAGPMTAMLMADQGANVIHIVKPGEPELPQQQFRLLNRNKKILTLDLKTDAGKAQALALIEKADVLIENFRPGVMKRLGLNYSTLKNKYTGLIYLSMPGFASTDKKRAHIQAWEGVLGAAVGLYREISLFREMLDFPPLYTSIPLCSMYGGVNGAIAVMAALVARQEQGVGTRIEIPLAEIGMVSNMFFFLLTRPGFALRDLKDTHSNNSSPDDAELPDTLKPLRYSPDDSIDTQQEKLEKARQLIVMPNPFCRAYRCSDERQIFINTFDGKHITDYLIKALDLYKPLLEEGFVNAGPWFSGAGQPGSAQKALNNNLCDMGGMAADKKARLVEMLEAVFLTKTAEDWETLLTRAGVMAAKIRTRDEWLSLEPMKSSGVLAGMDNGESELVVPGRAVDIGELSQAVGYEEPVSIGVTDAETLFENNICTSSQKNGSDKRPHKNNANQPQLKKGDLLKSVKILDMANIAAGPLAGYFLTEYGAQVIKADPPQYLAPAFVFSSVLFSHGKRSILTDVKTAPGREVLQRLIGWADVVQHNVLDDTARRLGISQAQLEAINPKVTGSQFSAFGGSVRVADGGNGWEKRPGFDFTLHGATGLMAHYGSLEQPQPHGIGSCGDMMGGFILAFASLLGVWQQRTTGVAKESRTSLARAMNTMQFPFMISENGNSQWGEARGQFALGESWLQRLYQCADGWIYVGATEDKAGALMELATGNSHCEPAAIESAFLNNQCAFWLDKLTTANIACHKVVTVNEICDGLQARSVGNGAGDEFAAESTEMLVYKDHPWHSPVITLAANAVRVGEDANWWRPPTAPRFGEQTTEILQELGYTPEQIAELIRLKVSHDFMPDLGDKHTYYFGQKA